MANPSKTKAMSNPRVMAIASLVLLKDHTSTPCTSFNDPKTARPANAKRPATALISMPVSYCQCLLRTVFTTKETPSAKYVKAEIERKTRIGARRGTFEATTTEVMGEDELLVGI